MLSHGRPELSKSDPTDSHQSMSLITNKVMVKSLDHLRFLNTWATTITIHSIILQALLQVGAPPCTSTKITATRWVEACRCQACIIPLIFLHPT